MDFVAIDFEKANRDAFSICQIGAIKYIDGQPKDEINQLIDPECEFLHDEFHVGKHGIDETAVEGKPTFRAYWPSLQAFIGDHVLVAHNKSSDRGMLFAALELIDESEPTNKWICTLAMFRLVFGYPQREFGKDFFKLESLCKKLRLNEYDWHDALGDAKGCAELALLGFSILEVNGEQLYESYNKKMEGWSFGNRQETKKAKPKKTYHGRDETPRLKDFDEQSSNKLEGLSFAITLDAIGANREEFQKLVECNGGKFKRNVSGKVDVVVVGEKDTNKWFREYLEIGEPTNEKWKIGLGLEKKGKLKTVFETKFYEIIKAETPKSFIEEIPIGTTLEHSKLNSSSLAQTSLVSAEEEKAGDYSSADGTKLVDLSSGEDDPEVGKF
ncbi:MAG: exonuclease domain-containing protein [Planctomycetaceae bacterium]